jgi:hypothetical protein
MPAEEGKSDDGDGGSDDETFIRQRRRQQYNYTVKEKIEHVRKAYSKPRYVYKYAYRSGVPDTYIRKWKKELPNLQLKASVNPHARSCHKGRILKEMAFESEVKQWVMDQREMDIAVRTQDIINHVIQVRPTFKKGVKKTLVAWVYKFLLRQGLSVRRVTRIGQKLSGHLKEVKDDCAAAIRSRMAPGGTLHGLQLKYFINMDQTAVYFEMKGNTTVHAKGEKTISVRDSGASKRATVCVAVAADGTRLPPFVVFKGMY